MLGRGAVGDVHRAVDRRSGATVAVKLLREDVALDSNAVERFRREARVLQTIRHPGIVELIEVIDDGGRQAIVLEMLSLPTLRQWLARGPLPSEVAATLAAAVLDALAAAHAGGVVHRDVKPENIHLGDGGQIRVTDFGIATVKDELSLTGSCGVLGTPQYVAPELLRGEEATAAADVWGVGRPDEQERRARRSCRRCEHRDLRQCRRRDRVAHGCRSPGDVDRTSRACPLHR